MLGFLRRSVPTCGQTIVMVTHDPGAAAYADRVLFLADGRIVDEMTEPTAELVLDRMKKFDVRARRGRASMLRVTFRSLLARKLRLILSSLSIVLGVAFVSGDVRPHATPWARSSTTCSAP